jgi:Family of unknown function (DUF6299)
MRFAKRLAMLVLAGLPATALTIGVSVPAAHAQELPPQLVLTVNPTGSIAPEVRLAQGKGDVTISGTYSCTNVNLVSITGSIQQQTSRGTISGYFAYQPVPQCNGAVNTWSTGLLVTDGRFSKGEAMTSTGADYCNLPTLCTNTSVDQPVQLRVRQ